jgi:hypothetical protein
MSTKPSSNWTCNYKGLQVHVYISWPGTYRAYARPMSKLLWACYDGHERLEFSNAVKKAALIWVEVFRDGMSLADYLQRTGL